MTTAELVAALRAQGIRLRTDGERLRVSAPSGVLDPELQRRLREQKHEILRHLRAEAGILPPVEPQSPNGPAPLSLAQERLWYLDQLVPDAAVYTIPVAYRLRGPLDVNALRVALEGIVARHDVLRASFAMRGDGPVLVTGARLDLSLPVEDFSSRPASRREADLHRHLSEVAAEPFDLTRGPLIRAEMIRLGTEEHVLFLAFHHAIFDGWSLGIFLEELAAGYEDALAGCPARIARPPVQYADYARWQRAWTTSPAMDRLIERWRDRFNGTPPPPLELPTDMPRPPLQTHAGAAMPFTLPRDAIAGLRDLAQAERGTLFMGLFAGLAALLSRHSGQSSFAIGTPTANRPRPELERLVGFFANTLVLPVEVDAQASFRDLLQQVRNVSLDAFQDQEMPFERLVDELQPPRDLSRTPLFQVLLAFQHAEDIPARMGSLTLERIRVTRRVAQTDLTFWMREDGADVAGTLEYSTDLFARDAAARLHRHLGRLIEGAVAAPDAPIRSLQLLDGRDRRHVLVDWNRTDSPYPTSARIEQLILAQARRTPDRTATRDERGELSYAELEQQIDGLAARLRDAGVTPGTVVGLAVPRSRHLPTALLAILRAGGTYLPLDPTWPTERLAFMLRDAGATVLLADPVPPDLPTDGLTIVRADERSPEAATLPAVSGHAGDTAYIIYTSGSTGQPKGIAVTHRAVVNFLTAMGRLIEPVAGDRLLAVTTLSFDIAVLELLLPLTVGAEVDVVGDDIVADGTALRDRLDGSRADWMQATPATWHLLLESGWRGAPGLTVLCGGETLTLDLARALLARVRRVWNLYGPTETTVWATAARLETDDTTVSIGRPIANLRVYVLDDAGRPAPVGVPGEICIGGAGVASGYVNRPELTASRFVPDPFSGTPDARMYRTGDLGRWRESGDLEFLRRMDDQVKVRGFRIELGEIEAVLADHPAVRRAVVTIHRERPGDERLVAYLVREEDREATTSELRNHLRSRLPPYMLPQHFVDVDRVPLTPNGKLNRRALPSPFGRDRPGGEDHVAPRTPMEQLIAEIWQDALGVERIGSHDNFFDLGGHSLLAMRVLARIEARTGVRLRPRALIQHSLRFVAATCQQGAEPHAKGDAPDAGADAPPAAERRRSLGTD